jgi:small subunit ribosomal protein S17
MHESVSVCFSSVRIRGFVKQNMPKKQLKGIVVSDKMKKTIVVEVERIKEHPKYKKRYKIHKKYKVNDEKEKYKVGDKVIIEECRPMSKEKKWRVVKPLK